MANLDGGQKVKLIVAVVVFAAAIFLLAYQFGVFDSGPQGGEPKPPSEEQIQQDKQLQQEQIEIYHGNPPPTGRS